MNYIDSKQIGCYELKYKHREIYYSYALGIGLFIILVVAGAKGLLD